MAPSRVLSIKKKKFSGLSLASARKRWIGQSGKEIYINHNAQQLQSAGIITGKSILRCSFCECQSKPSQLLKVVIPKRSHSDLQVHCVLDDAKFVFIVRQNRSKFQGSQCV